MRSLDVHTAITTLLDLNRINLDIFNLIVALFPGINQGWGELPIGNGYSIRFDEESNALLTTIAILDTHQNGLIPLRMAGICTHASAAASVWERLTGATHSGYTLPLHPETQMPTETPWTAYLSMYGMQLHASSAVLLTDVLDACAIAYTARQDG